MDDVEQNLEQNLEMLNKWIELGIEFAIKYGFQIAGALLFFLFGLIVANWIGNRIEKLAHSKHIDLTLSRFIGSTIKLILIVMLVIITLGNFGVSIAPLIALAGAATFGATLALQGPLSNFGAGLSIILTRPFIVGNVINVHGVSGIVDKITLGATFLLGEDGEIITIPNKEIVGQILVNSHETRILETVFCVSSDADADALIEKIKTILKEFPDIGSEPEPQVGIHDFTYGGIVIGLRAWVPGQKYFQIRYGVNSAILTILRADGIQLFTPNSAVALPNLQVQSTLDMSPTSPDTV